MSARISDNPEWDCKCNLIHLLTVVLPSSHNVFLWRSSIQEATTNQMWPDSFRIRIRVSVTCIICYGWWVLRCARIRSDKKKKWHVSFFFSFFSLTCQVKSDKTVRAMIWYAHFFSKKKIISIRNYVWPCHFFFFYFSPLQHHWQEKNNFYSYFLLQGRKTPIGIGHPVNILCVTQYEE